MISHSTLHIAFLALFLLAACGDFMEPVESTPEPTAYEFNYWLINQTYLYEDELQNLPAEGDSVPLLYSTLTDKYTRYYPPSKSEAAESQMNTTVVEGDLGMEYKVVYNENDPNSFPILISRVYSEGPAGRAKVPRYGTIISANGIELYGRNAKAVYDSIVAHSATVALDVFHEKKLQHYDLVKETIYAPTIFLDTLSGITFITISEFKISTADKENGTVGELKAYLDSTKNESNPRVLDLRNNPGGLIGQCLPAADLFVKDGLMSAQKIVSASPAGKRNPVSKKFYAHPGGPGENGKFIVLANRASASCAEIFIAAVKEQGNIPIVGETTYGKGIGQGQWKTIEGGLAVITNMEFTTPKGNSYHNKGISPDIGCPNGVSWSCAVDAIGSLYGTTKTESKTASSAELAVKTALLNSTETRPPLDDKNFGGALDTIINFVNYSYSP